MIRVPVCGSQEEEGKDGEGDDYSSDGSVIRVPIDGEQGDGDADEDGYSSSGSVIRVDASEGACRPDCSVVRAPVASNTDENDGCSSDGSVIRLPTDKAGVGGGVDGMQETTAELGLERAHNDGTALERGSTGKVPAHLLAASKYFGPKGAGFGGGAGASTETQRNRSKSSQSQHENPQVQHVVYGTLLDFSYRNGAQVYMITIAFIDMSHHNWYYPSAPSIFLA